MDLCTEDQYKLDANVSIYKKQQNKKFSNS